MSENNREKGIITASTGNHGLATAYAMNISNTIGKIILPNKVSDLKLNKLKQFMIELEFYGDDSAMTEVYARKLADEQGMTYVSPYNDYEIIAGQGTIGVELEKQLEQIDHIFITVGGGGLISGLGSYLKSMFPDIKIYACQPKNSAVMFHSVKSDKIIEIESENTLSDGSAGGIEQDSITFEIVKIVVDEFILVSEEDIKNAISFIFRNHNQIIEGAAGVAVAGYNKIKSRIDGIGVIILCGGNISPETFLQIVQVKT